MANYTALISGVGAYVPEYILTNAELEKIVDTNDEWIVSRTGIRERRILKDPNLGVTYMAAEAVKDLQSKVSFDVKEIEVIIFATCSADYLVPASANILAEKIGATQSYGFDLGAACSGYIYALSVASQMIESGRHKKVLLVAGDKMSSIVNYEDRKTCILFGDGCTATLLERSENTFGIKNYIHEVDGSGYKYLYHLSGGSVVPNTKRTVEMDLHYVSQEGAVVFKSAVTKMAEVTEKIMEQNDLTVKDVHWFVPHQANLRIINSLIKKADIDPDKVIVNINRYGNTTCATIPLCLWEKQQDFKKGDKLILTAFGGGFSWGAVYLQWGYDS